MAIESTTSTSTSTVTRVKNSVDSMMSPGIGPEQARVKITSLRYVSFDYNGALKDDPVISARALCTPTDGSNDNKDFEIDWSTGAKMKDFSIMDDGKWLAATGSKASLTNTSNFALFQRSLKDAGYDVNQFDSDSGLATFDNAELTLRRIVVKREGFQGSQHQAQQASGQTQRDNQYYTCLKIDSLPGESKKAGGTKKTTTSSAKPATSAAPKAASNGTSNGSGDITSVIESIVRDSGGSTSLKDFKMSLFRHFKEEGKAVAECQKLATEYGTGDALVTMIMENGLSWSFEGDTLSIS